MSSTEQDQHKFESQQWALAVEFRQTDLGMNRVVRVWLITHQCLWFPQKQSRLTNNTQGNNNSDAQRQVQTWKVSFLWSYRSWSAPESSCHPHARSARGMPTMEANFRRLCTVPRCWYSSRARAHSSSARRQMFSGYSLWARPPEIASSSHPL